MNTILRWLRLCESSLRLFLKKKRHDSEVRRKLDLHRWAKKSRVHSSSASNKLHTGSQARG
jgi:hypothetical protein